MMDKNKVSNPLSLIAIFAGSAEVVATVVLATVSESVQQILVWYVISFPVFLVLLFFITLWINHTLLYAPSDFSNEQYFFELAYNKFKKDAEDAIETSKAKNPEAAKVLEDLNGQISDLKVSVVTAKTSLANDILEKLAETQEGMTVTELTATFAVSRATLYSTLNDLVYHGRIVVKEEKRNINNKVSRIEKIYIYNGL